MSKNTEIHRHLLQYLLFKGYEESSELKKVLQSYISQHHASKEATQDKTLEDIIKTINEELDSAKAHMRVNNVKRENSVFYGIVNQKTDDEICKMATTYSPTVLLFLKKIVRIIHFVNYPLHKLSKLEEAEDDEEKQEFCVTDAYNEREKSMSLDDAELAIKQFIQAGWLEKKAGEQLEKGPRTLLDLRHV